MKKIIPAILTKNVADLKSNLGRLQGLTDWAQVDIMDGKFVNNISVSLDDVNRANIYKNLSLEAHLMVENPEKYFKQCQKGNIKRVIFHIEAAKDLKKLLDDIAGLGMQRGLALKPGTSINEIEPYIDSVDVILLMSVEPGFQQWRQLFQYRQYNNAGDEDVDDKCAWHGRYWCGNRWSDDSCCECWNRFDGKRSGICDRRGCGNVRYNQ